MSDLSKQRMSDAAGLILASFHGDADAVAATLQALALDHDRTEATLTLHAAINLAAHLLHKEVAQVVEDGCSDVPPGLSYMHAVRRYAHENDAE